MNYTDKTAVEKYTNTTIAGGDDAQLTEWITAMSRFMDQYCGITLVGEAPAVTRVYDGTGEAELKIDSVYGITAVTVDGTAVTPLKYPANSPRTYLLKLPDGTFTVGMQNVAVTGIFARLNALPADLKFACTVLVAGIVIHSKKQTDGIKSEKVGEYQVVYKDEKERADYARAMQILDSYKKVVF
jgi:hypothetical protein